MTIKKHPLKPNHLYLDNTPYFITTSTNQHKKLLDDDLKTQLQNLLHSTFKEYHWQLDHWVILDNHYHLLCHSKRGKDLQRIINKVHNLSSQIIRSRYSSEEKVWSNYWDYCPRNEQDYQTRLCYLLNNPYKHGYVDSLHDWEWSSFHSYFTKIGKENMQKKFRDFLGYRDLVLHEEPL